MNEGQENVEEGKGEIRGGEWNLMEGSLVNWL